MQTLMVYCILIAMFSTLGGALPALIKLTHRKTQMILSFVSGVMLGVALLNLLPHAVYVLDDPTRALTVCLIGLLFMFLMVRMFHFHQHDSHVEHSDDEICAHTCSHESHQHAAGHERPDFTWAGLCFGLAVHTLIDGVALATAVTASQTGDWAPAGLAVFLAILLHKPLDALSITSLMAAKGWEPNVQMTVNIVFAAVCPLSALLFALGVDFLDSEWRTLALGYSLAFSAGIFLCISLGDLLPEVHFHSHDRLSLTAMLLLGVVVAYVIELGHEHEVNQNSKESASISRVSQTALEKSQRQDHSSDSGFRPANSRSIMNKPLGLPSTKRS